MRTLQLAALLLAGVAVAFGQLDSDTLTVTAVRSVNLQPDQVVFGIYVTTSPDMGLDDALAELQGTGVTAADLSSVVGEQYVSAGTNPTYPSLLWSFTITVPLAKTSTTLAALIGSQQSITKNNPQYEMTFYTQGMKVSPELQASQACSEAALVQDARAQAQNLAAAAGVAVGRIVQIRNGGLPVAGPAPPAQLVSANFLLATPNSTGTTSSALSNVLVSPQPSCALTVQFQMLH